MIIAERKPIDKILAYIGDARKVLLLGCGGCVTVCLAGGEKEMGLLQSQLNMYFKKEGKDVDIKQLTIERQCDAEFIEAVRHETSDAEVVISFACGIGIQACAEMMTDTPVYPGVNTKFMGFNKNVGEWVERCQACGDCVLDQTGGICPVARCSKSIFNGPCGGSQNGKCEVGKGEIDCGWALILDRLARLGQLDNLLPIQPLKDWSHSRDGGPRKLVREELYLESGE